ncbi:hypothetical protein BDA99DRAFT_246271 [Phascolomyces articulosus]|uniref:Uncharacterized protein n=1 Tax=Phascolomyces articulosus TaxID=60185 RepID=A0AAD5KS60_9FUNG|nr:hypothetical protein BDA99DRAFT_246271 [Phascolomyces articulosus]
MDQIGQLVSYLPTIDREKLPTIASITTAVFVVLYAYKKTTATNQEDEVPKGLKPVPVAPGRQFLFGHLLTLGKRPVLQLQKWHEAIGK